MSKYILLNPTPAGALSPRLVMPGNVFDSVTQATDITNLLAAGGLLVPNTSALAQAAATLAQNKRLAKGSNEAELTWIMLAGLLSPDPQSAAVAGTTSADLAEAFAIPLAGGGTITGAYFVPSATATYTAGNKQVLLVNLYDATGTLVGAVATGTIGDGVTAQQPTKWARLSLGAITNPVFGDGYTLTLTSTHTGTIVLAAGTLVVVTKPTL